MKRRTSNFRTPLITAIVTAAITLPPISTVWAAPQQSETITAPAAAQVPGIPRLVRFSGALKSNDGKIPSGNITMTFSLYQDQQGGNPLWTETEPVQVAPDGHYSVLLGATDPGGLPADLFNANKPRWVGVVANAPGIQSELPRVLLVGVPYALKAADSETLGGKPASAYVTTEALSALTQANSSAPATTLAVTPAVTAIAGTGTTNFLPIWTNGATLGNSTIFETNNNVGIGTTTPASTLDVNGGATIRGPFQLVADGTATATTGFTSHTENFFASAFNSATQAAATQNFRWQAEPAGNNTTAPSATLNLLFGANNAAPAETGLSINNHGVIKFASGQTFPGTGGGAITSVKAGTDLTGGGTSGTVTLNLDTTKVPQLSTANTFTGNQGITGNLGVSGTVSAVIGNFSGALGAASLSLPAPALVYMSGSPFLQGRGNQTFVGMNAGPNSQGRGNVAFGATALGQNTVGVANTAVGTGALFGNLFGYSNVAVGYLALQNTANDNNTGVGQNAGSGNRTGTLNTFLGALADTSSASLTNATAIGAFAKVAASDSLVLGGSYTDTNNLLHRTKVGIGTSAPTQPLTIQADDNANGGLTPRQLLIQGNTDTSKQLLIGYLADPNGNGDGFGALQAVHENVAYTPLLLNPYGGNIGIRTSSPSNVFTIGQGTGVALADGWATYSSRRWKTNIQTLPNTLAKVVQLRGVSYDLKENGKHEIGVIAEEVGQVYPEMVSWDKNGKDANGVDYSRLTAVLIEAVKQQQHEIQQQQAMLQAQAVAMQKLTAEVNSERQALRQVKAQIASSEVKLRASR